MLMLAPSLGMVVATAAAADIAVVEPVGILRSGDIHPDVDQRVDCILQVVAHSPGHIARSHAVAGCIVGILRKLAAAGRIVDRIVESPLGVGTADQVGKKELQVGMTPLQA